MSAQQIGPARQLVLWREEHFRSFAGFLNALALRAEVAVFEIDELDPAVRGWADAHGITDRKRQRDEAGKRVFQIDGIVDGEPAQRIVHRCAAARAADSARPRSSAEMLVLWGCYVIAASCAAARGTGATKAKSG